MHNSKVMVTALGRVQEPFGLPLQILSGYRDYAYNIEIGGARFSRHVYGDAVDISMRGMSDAQRYTLMSLLMHEGFTSSGNYARYPNMLHAAMRPKARIWRHGDGNHPAWFRHALSDWGWKRDHGPTRTPQTHFAQK